MADFIEVHDAAKKAFTINTDTVRTVERSSTGHAILLRTAGGLVLLDETYEAIRDLLQGKVTKLSNAYKEW